MTERSAASVLASEHTWCVLQEDSRLAMAAMPPESVDAVVCDPPYGLSQEPDIAEVLTHWLAGDDHTATGGGFMGKSWDSFVPGPAHWKEVLRVLKPGGYVLAFSATRTADLMTIALRLAGFEIRDSFECFGLTTEAHLHWVYGSGFPKSLNISLAIDKADGIEDQRAILSSYTAGGNAGTSTKDKGGTYGVGVPNSDPVELYITAGASERSRAWDGWGTALKPAHEPIIVARKPMQTTVAENVLKHGTGGMNLDACRIEGAPRDPGFVSPSVRDDGWGMQRPPLVGRPTPEGRWPPNVLLVHAPECQRVGTKKVKSHNPDNVSAERTSQVAYGKMDARSTTAHADADGLEEVEDWNCVEGCSVRALAEQSGDCPSAGNQTAPLGTGAFFGSAGDHAHSLASVNKGDSGTAARYFPAFCYSAKASRSEREAGCEKLPKVTGAKAVEREEGSAGAKNPRAGAGRTAKIVRNPHPTVKPIELLRWLVRLVTPPNGVVLDPFCGSGSMGCAAWLEGFRYIGMDNYVPEFDPELKEQPVPYAVIARARIEHVARKGKQTDLFGLLGF